jgi:hypothetical protein
MPNSSGEAMARYKSYDDAQMVMMPVALEKQLLPGTVECAIHILVQRCIDTSIFDGRYKNDAAGCPAYAPQVLLKIV